MTFSDNLKDRGKAFGVFGAISGAGGAIGLLLGAIVFLRGGTRPARVQFDVAGAVTAVLGLAGIVYGLGNAAGHGWTAPVTLIPPITGVVLLAVFVIVERRVEHPLLHSRTNRGQGLDRPPAFDADAYRTRNTVERSFNEHKQWRGIATRYDKHAINYRGGVVLRAITIWLRE